MRTAVERIVVGHGTDEVWTRGRALYRVPEAMALLNLSRTVLYEQIRAGRLRSVKRGRTRLIPAEAIAEYVALLESEAGEVVAR